MFQLSIYDNGATFGHSLLDLKFSNSSTKRRILFATLVVGGKYALARCRSISRFSSDENTYIVSFKY
jgi:hypothetical protein